MLVNAASLGFGVQSLFSFLKSDFQTREHCAQLLYTDCLIPGNLPNPVINFV